MAVRNKLLPLLLLPTLLFAQRLPLAECQRLAGQNDPEALWQLGQRCEEGDGLPKNAVRAIVLYKRAAEKRHPQACERLATLYERGTFVPKSPQQAARYRALAKGETPAETNETPTPTTANAQDELEIALDYLLGRNGKAKDPSTGIRILYANAQNNPTAQRLFVDAWRTGRLDDALTALSNEEWEKLYPWFEEGYVQGKKSCGLILGNRAFDHGHYDQALSYWQASDLPNAWFFVGEFYNPEGGKRFQSVPSRLKSERKAIQAYERCWTLGKKRNTAAAWALAMLYVSANDQSLRDLSRAHAVGVELYKRNPNDGGTAFLYGATGARLLIDAYETQELKLRKWAIEHGAKKQIKNQTAIENYQKAVAKLREDLQWRAQPYLKALAKVPNPLRDEAMTIRRRLEDLMFPGTNRPSWR